MGPEGLLPIWQATAATPAPEAATGTALPEGDALDGRPEQWSLKIEGTNMQV